MQAELAVCHSDHHLLINDNQRPWFQEKYTLVRGAQPFGRGNADWTISQGHEGCGEIVSIGKEAKGKGFDIVSLLASYFIEKSCPLVSRGRYSRKPKI